MNSFKFQQPLLELESLLSNGQLQSAHSFILDNISTLEKRSELILAAEKMVRKSIAFGEYQQAIDFIGNERLRLSESVQFRVLKAIALNNALQYEQAYKTLEGIGINDIEEEFVNAFFQINIKQGRFSSINVHDLFNLHLDVVAPVKLPNYIGVNGIRNRVFDEQSLNKYLALQRKWGDHMMAEAKASPLPQSVRDEAARNRNKDGRVRLGFYALSDIFDTQTVLRPILKVLNRTVFEVHLAFIENGRGVLTDKSFTDLFENVIHVPRGSNRDAAIKLAEMGCDILVDLNGLQQPATRVGAMAWRLAPLQLSWTGRPITCGLPALDYNIVDDVLAADGSGTLNDTLRLPDAFACFGSMPDFEIVTDLPSVHRGHITFAINAEPAKFNPGTIEMWAAAIKAKDGSHVVFMRPEYSSPVLRNNILTEFSTRGIGEERIEFWSEATKDREHMKLYNEVDILLDCYPMTGGIGMLEALHMGVPAVSLEGPAIQLRVGASHLHAVGLDALRAKTVDEYVEKIALLADDIELRRELRHNLRFKLSKTAFVDIDKFATGFNGAMQSLIEHPALQERIRQKSTQGVRMSDEEKIAIDGKEYSVNEMSKDAKEQLNNVRIVDQKLSQLQQEIAILQTARSAYAQALKAELKK